MDGVATGRATGVIGGDRLTLEPEPEPAVSACGAVGSAPSRAVRLLTEAARLFTDEGVRLLDQGRARPAVPLFRRAGELLCDVDDPELRAAALEPLLTALVDAGQVSSALRLARDVDELECAGLSRERVAALRTRLAWAAAVAGDPEAGLAQVDAARESLPAERAGRPGPRSDEPAGRTRALLDAVAADLTAQRAQDGTARAAHRLARRALHSDLPEARCYAWNTLGALARRIDVAGAGACFERARALAQDHRLPLWRLRAQLQIGVGDWLLDGRTMRLEQVRENAGRMEAGALACSAAATLALDRVLRGRHAEAGALIEEYAADAARLGLAGTARRLAAVHAVNLGHQGRREDLDAALAELGDAGDHAPLVHGLAMAFCSLLDEDGEGARRDVAAAAALERVRPGPYSVAGRHGLHLLLENLYGAAGEPREEIAGALAWNRPFVEFARAVWYGRQGRAAEAERAVERAVQYAAPYDLARHLGLRLVAEAAYRDGWGRPADWLRPAEEYFRGRGHQAVAAACRTLLRRCGVPAPQRRRGAEDIPGQLRALGVTVREYEVMGLLVAGHGNRSIAERLHISPRTVEKHVASLLMKVRQPNRGALIAFGRASLRAAQP
ncbi:MAG TPA: LuxR C-terminal-related transcriptional regulator [Streptosporangiaceae bacterium]